MFDFKDIPEKPPRSIALLPGLKYASLFDKWTLLLLIVIILMVAIFPIMMFLSMEKSMRLPFIEMEKADGIVNEIMDDSKCDRKSVAIHYYFMTKENRTYYGKYVTCQGSKYSTLKVGDSIPIVYDPKDSSFNGIEGELGKNDPPFIIFLFFPLFFLFIFAPMLMPNLKQVRNARSIFKNGIIIKGEIIFIGRKKLMSPFNFKGLTSMEVFYRFNTLDGKIIEAKTPTNNEWLTNKFEIGSTITVSYIEKKPKKSIILEFYYR